MTPTKDFRDRDELALGKPDVRPEDELTEEPRQLVVEVRIMNLTQDLLAKEWQMFDIPGGTSLVSNSVFELNDRKYIVQFQGTIQAEDMGSASPHRRNTAADGSYDPGLNKIGEK